MLLLLPVLLVAGASSCEAMVLLCPLGHVDVDTESPLFLLVQLLEEEEPQKRMKKEEEDNRSYSSLRQHHPVLHTG